MGCNISCDLHIVHLNRRLKGMMTGMHCDTKAIERAAKAIGAINSICDTLERIKTQSVVHEGVFTDGE